MSNKIQGAYVRAWVWVDANTFLGPDMDTLEIEESARRAAEGQWQTEGEIELDADAEVSLSYDG